MESNDIIMICCKICFDNSRLNLKNLIVKKTKKNIKSKNEYWLEVIVSLTTCKVLIGV